jgi:integrase
MPSTLAADNFGQKVVMNGDLVRTEPLRNVLRKGGTASAPVRPASQKPAAEKALRQILRFVDLVGQTGVAVSLTRDELARALAARADATLVALASDLDCFAAYCLIHTVKGLPAHHESVARYVEQLWQTGPSLPRGDTGAFHSRVRVSKPLKPASIARRLASIGMLHTLLQIENPCRTANVRNAMTIARRACGVKQRQAAPLRLAVGERGRGHEGAREGDREGEVRAEIFTLEALLEGCDDSLGGLRDAALLSTAYDGGFRASEVTGLLLGDLRRAEPHDNDGLGFIYLEKSKTDQERAGVWVPLSAQTILHIDRWIDATGIEGEGDQPLFRRIQALVRKGRKGRRALDYFELAPNAGFSAERLKAIPPRALEVRYEVGEGALSVGGVNLILRRAAQRAADRGLVDLTGEALGTAIKALSSHSMRVGLTQDLLSNGADALGTTIALRWSDPKTALRYARNLPTRENAAAKLLAQRRK